MRNINLGIVRLAQLCAGTSLLALAPSALAQSTTQPETPKAANVSDSAADPADVTVTARRREETLQSVPLSVSVLSSAQIERQRVETFADIARLTPSLVFDTGFGLQDTRPVIRGLPSTRGRPPVGILIDGVDASSEAMGSSAGGSTLLNIRALDVERIEVVEGPQSALYGRVAFGGAVNYVTKRPSSTFGAEVGGEVGSYDTYELRGAITGPIADGVAFRANGYHAENGGYYRNQVTGNRVGGFSSYGGGVSLSLDRPGGNAVLRASYSDDRDQPAAQEYIGSETGSFVTLPLPAGVAGQVVGVGAGAPLPASTQGIPFGTLTRTGFGVNLSRDPRTGTDYPGSRVRTLRVSLNAELALADKVNLTWITSYTHSRFSERDDTDFFGFPLTTVPGPGGAGPGEPVQRFNETNITNGDVKQLNQEIRVGNLEGGPFRWAVGGLFWYEKYQQDDPLLFYTTPAPFSASRAVPLVQNNLPFDHGSRTTDHESVYGILEYDITPQLTASAEARYAHETYNYVFSPVLTLSPIMDANGIFQPTVLAQPNPAKSSTNYFTPKGTIRYTPNPGLMFYASVAKGVKPAGYSTVSVFDSSTANFGVETLYNYEVGGKADLFDRKLSLSTAFFHMIYKGKQTSVIVPTNLTPTGFLSIVRNVGGAKVNGVEAQVTFRPVRSLTLSAGYTYLDARYTDFDEKVNSALVGSQIQSCTPIVVGTGKFCQTNLRGNRLERSPEHSLVASGRFTQPLMGSLDAFVEGDARYTSNRPLDEFNTRFIPSSTTVNFRVGVENSSMSLLAYVDNAFASDAIQGAIGIGDAYAPGTLAIIVQPPNPRTVGVRARYRF